MQKITIYNSCNTQVAQISREEHDGKFIFKGNMLSRLSKTVELSHKWVLKCFKDHEPALFDNSEGITFEVPPVETL